MFAVGSNEDLKRFFFFIFYSKRYYKYFLYRQKNTLLENHWFHNAQGFKCHYNGLIF